MKKTMYILLTMLLAFSMIFASCNQNTEIPEEEIPEDPNAVKIDFENITATPWYSPETAMTTIDSESTASQSTDFKVSGTKSLKITGKLQDDKYSSDGFTMEMGIRIKPTEILDVSAVALLDQIFSLKVYVPAGAINTSVQVNLQSTNYEQAMGAAQTITAGQWNTLYYKLISKDDPANTKYPGTKPTFAVCSADGTVTAQGAYTGASFDIDDIKEIEIRSLGPSEESVAGTEVTLYVDDIDWAGDAGSVIEHATKEDYTFLHINETAYSTAYHGYVYALPDTGLLDISQYASLKIKTAIFDSTGTELSPASGLAMIKIATAAGDSISSDTGILKTVYNLNGSVDGTAEATISLADVTETGTPANLILQTSSTSVAFIGLISYEFVAKSAEPVETDMDNYTFLKINDTPYTSSYQGYEYALTESGLLNISNYASLSVTLALFDADGNELSPANGLAQIVLLNAESTTWTTGVLITKYNMNAAVDGKGVNTIDISALTTTGVPAKIVIQNSSASVAYVGLISYSFVLKTAQQ